MVTTVVQRLKVKIRDSVQPPAFDVETFAGPASPRELGDELATPAFTASYNRPPTFATLTDDIPNTPQDVSATPEAFSSVNNYNKTTPNQSVQWDLSAGDAVGGDSESLVVQWQARHWFGFHASAGPLTEAEVLAMTQLQTALSGDTTFDHTFAAVAGLYFHHVWHDFFLPLDPSKYITDGLFPTGVTDAGAVAIAGTPSPFTARDVRSLSLIDTGGQPIRIERRL